MAAEFAHEEIATLLGVTNVQTLKVKSSNSYKYKAVLPNGLPCFIKLCSTDELQCTQAAIALAPEAVLPYLGEAIASYRADFSWVTWSWMPFDGYVGIMQEASLELVWQRLGACWQALDDFHSQGLTHGDCKLENFMFNQHEQARLIDFECSNGGQSSAGSYCVGTPAFAAPEAWPAKCGHMDCEHHDFNQSIDVYSLAASFLVRFGIKTPAYNDMLKAKARRCLYKPKPSCPAEGDELMLSGLFKAKSRPDLNEVWQQRLETLVTCCCMADPSSRWDAKSLLSRCWTSPTENELKTN
eukprot:m.165697 g.165697  ORF g.165697 m.165697 type:complete len:298 (-) comp16602_c0_seq1:22-915(-)